MRFVPVKTADQQAAVLLHRGRERLVYDARLPDLARQVLQVLAAQIEQLEAAVAAIEKQLMAWHKSNPVSQRLASVPGIGPIKPSPPWW
jgi:transposase